MQTCSDLVNASHIEGSQVAVVTYESHRHIGGGDPYWTQERSFKALYRNGAVFTPRLVEETVVYDHLFSVASAPERLTKEPLRRFLTNHGTHAAARQGGSPVTIRLAA